MAQDVSSLPSANKTWKELLVLLGCLVALLSLLFYPSFKPEQVLFANDGPLGAQMAAAFAMPEAFKGIWADLTWVGGWAGRTLPTMTYALTWILKPVGFAKFYAPLTLLILGLSAWMFFRQLGFLPVVALLGGLAAALNMDFFSYACWGLGTLPLCAATVFLALAALVSHFSHREWLKYILAGAAVGMGVMEGFDNGAIFSLFVSAFVLFQSVLQQGQTWRVLTKGIGRIVCLAVFAALTAAYALSILTATQIKGIVGAQQDAESKAARWEFATDFSFPKIETLRILIPGLFGYGLPEMYGIPANEYGAANYWGSIGQSASWEAYLNSSQAQADPKVSPHGAIRFNGAGVYAGILVVMIGALGIAQSLRKTDNIYTSAERKYIWFWSVMALISLLFAFGRYAPFYRLIYSLPYFSTIRIPFKWMHPFNVSLLILFGYGLEGLFRRYLLSAVNPIKPLKAHLKSWWAAAPVFEKKWMRAMLILWSISLLGWVLYAGSRSELERHLQKVDFPAQLATSIAGFSSREIGFFVLFLTSSIICLTLILSGWLGGRRMKWVRIILGVLLVVDLGRANAPWIVHYDYKEKYAINPIIDILRERPYEHRVAAPKFSLPKQLPPEVLNQVAYFQGKTHYQDWLQNLFPFYNIQSLDIIQMSRTPEDIEAFQRAVGGSPLRMWQLTNTRYLLTWIGFIEALNQQFDPDQRRFRLHTAFGLAQKSVADPVTVQTNGTGPLALIEFSGALPRAKLYDNWQTITNDAVLLQQLANPSFDPAQTVLVANPISPPAPGGRTNSTSGVVSFKSYAPKRIELQADANIPSVLLLNDRFDPQWKVLVDGRLETLLRCNFHMRGVFLQPGKHAVEFRFEPPTNSLYISLAAIALGIGLCGFVVFSKNSPGPASAHPSAKR